MERDGLESVLQRAATGDAEAFGTVVRRFQDLTDEEVLRQAR
jgi:hypothetical protein